MRIGVQRFGSSSLKMIRAGDAPVTLAASTNSRSRRARTSPRSSRAMEAQPKAVMTEIRVTTVSQTGVFSSGSTRIEIITGQKAMKKSVEGKASRMSMTRPTR